MRATRTRRRLEGAGPHKKGRTTAQPSRGQDLEYGPLADPVDMTEEQLEEAKQVVLSELQKEVASFEMRDNLQRSSQGQRLSCVWRRSRSKRFSVRIWKNRETQRCDILPKDRQGDALQATRPVEERMCEVRRRERRVRHICLQRVDR
jgi:hypothetical protein